MSQDYLVLEDHHINTETGKLARNDVAPHKRMVTSPNEQVAP